MLYMMCWNIRDGCHQEAVQKFLETQAPLPEGLKQVGRYHAPGSSKGWLVVETSDTGLVYQHASEWAHLLTFDVVPVVEDQEAGKQSSVIWAKQ